jgi:hypothetical protein
MTFGIYDLYRRLQPGFRRRRIQLFLDECRPRPESRVLDVGGYRNDWEEGIPVASQVTLLNVSHPRNAEDAPKRFTTLVGDGRALAFEDGSFDIVFSNSVIEHVGDAADQQRFADEARRVGKKVFVQTPNRWFFVETHFVTLFVHYLPRGVARRLLPLLSLRGILRQGDDIDLLELARELRLLSFRELQALFPDCEIHREKWLGLTKSFMAVRSGESG